MMEENDNALVREVAEKKYAYGFTTDVHTEIIDKGLSEDVVRLISQKKGEPDWLLDFRLQAYHYWLTLEPPTWGHLQMPQVDFQDISYYADPTRKRPSAEGKAAEIDPELMKTFDKLGIPLEERMALSGTAVDAVMDSVSVKTTFREKLREGHHLLLHQRSRARTPRAGAPVSGLRRSLSRQFLCRPEQRRLQRRLVRLYPARRTLPHGTLHLFPHQCTRHRPV